MTTEEKIVIVTGSRSWTNDAAIMAALDSLDPEVVIHGGARGADTVAHRWAKKRGRIAVVYFPDYEREKKGAPLKRNTAMVVQHPDATLVACPLPDSRGTRFTMSEAHKQGMAIVTVKP